jgi:polyisoprenyl-phosphate glycosyltransferase
MALISIIVPTHNEAQNIQILYERLCAVFQKMPEHQFELIFSDDSADSTPQMIAQLRQKDERVKLIRLSRRFDQSIAIAAGLDHCRGDAAVLMDADLQDPPEVLPRMLALWGEGNEIVYVQRQSASDYAMYRVYSWIFYRVLRKLASVEIPLGAGEFRVLDRKVIQFLQQVTEHSRYLRGLTVWPGMRQASIQIDRPARNQGQTKYNFRRSLLNAVDGIVSFSIVPLRWAMVAGVSIAALSFFAGLVFVGIKLLHWIDFSVGWTSLIVSMFFLGGVQLMVMGILGEYIGRIFLEVQNRPVYWIDFTLGFAEQDARRGARDLRRTASDRTL